MKWEDVRVGQVIRWDPGCSLGTILVEKVISIEEGRIWFKILESNVGHFRVGEQVHTRFIDETYTLVSDDSIIDFMNKD